MDKRRQDPILVAFILGLAVSMLFALAIYIESYKVHLKYEVETVKASFNNTLSTYKKLADYVYEIKFNKNEELLELLHTANEDPALRPRIREIVYERLKSDYEILKKLGVKQFHIHLANGLISFIRFHRPDLWGDSLRGFRESLEKVLRTGESVHGFEEGKVYSGFRNVYPLIYRGEIIGSVEISIGLNALAVQTLLSPDHYAKIIIKRDLVKKKVYEDLRDINYTVSSLSENFLQDISEEETIWASYPKGMKGLINYIESRIKGDIEDRLSRFEVFSESVIYNMELYHVFFIPFREIKGDWAGYLVYYQKDTIWMQYIFFNLAMIIFFLLVYSSLFFVIYKLYKQILILKSKDVLTNLWRRETGLSLGKDAVRASGENLSVLFMDLDNFKRVNDQFGHKIGDEVLKRVAGLIKDRLRKRDVLLRYGGEEFVAVLPDTDLKGAVTLAEDIRRRIESCCVEPIGRITVSIGVAQMKQGEELEDVINRADKAMYKAKQLGKNRVEADLSI